MSTSIQLATKLREGRPSGMASADVGQRFLEFTFPKDLHALLPLGNLQGAIEIQFVDILPVPEMSAGLLGILNWRGQAIWIADLSYLAGGAYYPPVTKAMVLMVQLESNTIGLVIDRTISVVARNPAAALDTDDNLCVPSLRSLVGGYFLDDRHQPWLMLDVPKVFQAIGL